MLWEPDGEGGLVAVATAGHDVPVALEAGAGVAYGSGRRFFVTQARGPGAAAVASVLNQLVLSGDRAVGVLAVRWDDCVEEAAQPLAALELLAAEAGVAIERAILEAELERAARTDVLTGLANRRVWRRRCRASWRARSATASRSPSRSSTSTTSSASTTGTATRRATACCAKPPRRGWRSCATSTSSRATGARSSPCCFPTPRERRPSRPSSACAPRRRRGTRARPASRPGTAARTRAPCSPAPTAGLGRDRTVAHA